MLTIYRIVSYLFVYIVKTITDAIQNLRLCVHGDVSEYFNLANMTVNHF